VYIHIPARVNWIYIPATGQPSQLWLDYLLHLCAWDFADTSRRIGRFLVSVGWVNSLWFYGPGNWDSFIQHGNHALFSQRVDVSVQKSDLSPSSSDEIKNVWSRKSIWSWTLLSCAEADRDFCEWNAVHCRPTVVSCYNYVSVGFFCCSGLQNLT